MSLPPRTERPPKRRRRFITLLIVTCLFLTGCGWAVKSFFLDRVGPKTVLLLGVDEDKTRSDVMLLARIDPQQGTVNLISLPRDTLVEIPCEGLTTCVTPDKLNHAHAYGGANGPEVATQTVESWLNVKIDGYVRVDFDGFQKLVEQLGGVDLVIDHNMNYEDLSAKPPLKIHFKASPEPQHLTGKEALEYVRFRDGTGDIGRTERTRKFFVALVNTMKQSGKLTKLPGLVTAFRPYAATNIDLSTAAALAQMASTINGEQIHSDIIPGEDKILKDGRWVWIADAAKTQDLVTKLIKTP